MTDTATEPAAATTPAERNETEYVILTLDGSGLWDKTSATTARSADAAIRQWVTGRANQGEVTVVAVPARSWKAVRVKPKIETTMVLEEL